MELRDVLQTLAKSAVEASQPCDFRAGTVVSENPLKIRIDPEMAPPEPPSLILTDGVVEKKLYGLLEGAYCTENGDVLPHDSESVTINRSLRNGDKIVLLRVDHGLRFLVVSRAF